MILKKSLTQVNFFFKFIFQNKKNLNIKNQQKKDIVDLFHDWNNLRARKM